MIFGKTRRVDSGSYLVYNFFEGVFKGRGRCSWREIRDWYLIVIRFYFLFIILLIVFIRFG